MRIRRTSVPALLLVAAALVAGCGGSEVPADEVPGGPVSLTPPTDESAGGSGSADSSSSSDDDASTTDDATTTDDTATTDDGTTTAPVDPVDPATGGAEAPAATDDGGTGTTDPATAPTDDPAAAPDTGGTTGTSEFCEQNAGAC